mgnify:CR=1 FL=1
MPIGLRWLELIILRFIFLLIVDRRDLGSTTYLAVGIISAVVSTHRDLTKI